MEKPGTSSSIMNNFFDKTKYFYKSLLDGLYAVADLLLDPRPEPKPPDIETKTKTSELNVQLEFAGTFSIEIIFSDFCSTTSTKKLLFDSFVKRRRKKKNFDVVILNGELIDSYFLMTLFVCLKGRLNK